jgi:hypothetical protein
MANMEQMQQHMQAMIQRVEAMEAALTQANAASSAASQRALDADARAQAAQSASAANGNGAPTPRFNSLVDTRLLSKPRNFDGTMGGWKQFKFLFTAYAGAVSADLRKIMHDATSASTDAECLNINMGVHERGMSTQLYYMLVLQTENTALRMLEHAGDCEGAYGWRRLVREYEPDTAGRHASLLLEILSFEFTEDTRGSLDSLDLLIMKYEDATKDTISEPLKVALVQRGIKDTTLREHLVMHSARLSDYVKVREEVRNIMVTRMAINNSPSPMDISALGKGKDGKGKGKDGKGKGKDGKGKDKGKDGKGKDGKGKDKGKGKDGNVSDDRVCFYCQKKGHVKADCRKLISDKKKSGGSGQHELSAEEEWQQALGGETDEARTRTRRTTLT